MAMLAADRLVVIDLSSSDDEDDEVAIEKKGKKKIMSSPEKVSVVEVFSKEEKARDDDECCILTFNPFDSLNFGVNGCLYLDSHRRLSSGSGEEVVILAERGKVACKDYPHSRHLCAEYPFHKTPHERFCAKCYCYVCDAAAPCTFWEEKSYGHCHACDKENWKNLRSSYRISLENMKNISTGESARNLQNLSLKS